MIDLDKQPHFSSSITDRAATEFGLKEFSGQLIESFPMPRYFQIHFEHVHSNVETMHKEIIQLRQYAVQLEEKLDKALDLLNSLAASEMSTG